MRIGSLFSGAGGLDIAVQAVFGGQVIWHAEIDKAASKVLAHHWPDVLNLGDVGDINWDSVPPVDILCGGFPCQDVSAAGKRAGIKDGTRSGLWSVFADAIDWLHPQIVVIENVRGLLSAAAHRMEPDETTLGDGSGRPVLRAAGAVLGDLADLGYDAQWCTVAAADVGAPHRRERVFIVAAAADSACGAGRDAEQQRVSPLRLRGESDVQQSRERCGSDPSCGGDAAHPEGHGRDEGPPEPARQQRGFDVAVSGDEPGVGALLPTPCVVDRLATGEMTLEEWDESRRAQKEKGVGSFGPRGDSLGAAVMRVDQGVVDERPDYSTTRPRLLPTPTSRDHKGRNQRDDDTCLPGALLPTPNAQDGNGGKAPRGGRATHDTGTKRQVPLTDLPDLLPTEQTTHWGKYEPAIRRWEQLTRPAPAPTEPNKNGNPRLSAAFSEWLMGWPAGWVTHPDIGISRNDQLRIVGNGVCPQQAAAALRYLMAVAA